jgi:transcriptional regulator with XRE-family HTH domain
MEELRRLRKEKKLSQAKLAALADLDPSTVNQIETGTRRANMRTLEKIAGVLGVEVADLFPKDASRSSYEPSLFNGVLAEERRGSRFAEVITAAAEEWGEAVSSPGMDDSKRLALIDAALRLSDLISQSVEEEDWEAIPNQERREIVSTMEELNAVSERGLQHLEAKTAASTHEAQIKHRREQIREWTRRISA